MLQATGALSSNAITGVRDRSESRPYLGERIGIKAPAYHVASCLDLTLDAITRVRDGSESHPYLTHDSTHERLEQPAVHRDDLARGLT